MNFICDLHKVLPIPGSVLVYQVLDKFVVLDLSEDARILILCSSDDQTFKTGIQSSAFNKLKMGVRGDISARSYVIQGTVILSLF